MQGDNNNYMDKTKDTNIIKNNLEDLPGVKNTIVFEAECPIEQFNYHKPLVQNKNQWATDDNCDQPNKLLQWTLCVSQIFLILVGVHALKMMLHFYLQYKVLFCQKDLVSKFYLSII